MIHAVETIVPKTTRKAQESGSTSSTGFEASLGELETLVERLEGGELSLEDALKDFERGIVLTRQCQQALKDAELRVQQLVQRNNTEDLEDFDSGTNDA